MVRGSMMMNRVDGEENDKSVRMMDDQSWASKMGEEDNESGRQWCVSFSGGEEEYDELAKVRVW